MTQAEAPDIDIQTGEADAWLPFAPQAGARTGRKNLDLGASYDHVFWAGDFNYRQVHTLLLIYN